VLGLTWGNIQEAAHIRKTAFETAPLFRKHSQDTEIIFGED
jgi:hypothetical protein